MPMRSRSADVVQYDHPDTVGQPGLLEKLEFFSKDGTTVLTLQRTVAGVISLTVAGGQSLGALAAAVPALTDSTGGVAASTLVAVGVTNTGDRSAQINANFASVNTQFEALKTSLINAGIVHS